MEGDANTQYFQLQACHQSRRSFIDQLVNQDCTLVDEEGKADAIFQNINDIFGVDVPRPCALNFDQLQLATANLSCTDFYFSEEEVWRAICSMPADTTPGSDGFTGWLYTTVWPVIKGDVMRAPSTPFGPWIFVASTCTTTKIVCSMD
jgi:hypothetical protein